MTTYIAICAAVFVVTYLVNTGTITIFYHRGWAHRAITMKPWLERGVLRWGSWLTGLDPKGWVCMHRLHHKHSDTEDDPHSPVHGGFFGILFGQLRSYERVLIGLARRDKKYTSMVADLDFDVSWLNKKRLWYLPYVVHLGIGLALGLAFGWWLLGAAYFLGMMSHPVEGWLVNAFGHAIGGRNFDTDDNSRNNLLVAWLVQGEGLQNNHHRYPSSAKFAFRWWEPDLGYTFCRLLAAFGMITIHREKLIPSPAARDEKRALA